MTGIHDDVETYEPKVDVTYENSLPKVDNTFDDITDENGNINIIINSEVIGQTLAKKIYTSWTSGLRELYNNEARACRTAKKMGGNPSIVITVDPNDSSRKITIQGVDSLGITKAMFNKVLRVIGTSGNTDGEEIGQYGMGFISYALMTDALLMETWSRETNEHYAMLCDSGLKFKPIPLDTTNDVNTMSEYGTKLTMTCNDDVKWAELCGKVQLLARFSQIPTKLIILDNIYGNSYRYDDEHQQDWEKGVYELDSYKNGMEYLKDEDNTQWLKNTTNEDSEKVLFYDEITIDNEDYRFDGIMVIKSTRYGGVNMITHSRTTPLLLVGTSIDTNVGIKGMHSSIINIKNERKYSPVASRDALENSAVDLLQDQINNDLSLYLEKYNIETIEEYNNSIHKCILADDPMYELIDYLSRGSKDISRTLNTRYSTPDKSHSTLNEMLAKNGTIVALKSLRSNLMDLLDDNIDGDVHFFRIPTRLSDEEKGHRIALFKELNIILGEDYKKTQQLKETRGKNTITKNGKTETYSGDRSIVLYNSDRGIEDSSLWASKNGWRANAQNFSTTINDVNENYHSNCLVVDKLHWDQVKRIVCAQSCDWKMMHDMKGISPKVTTFNKLCTNVNKKMYQTNDGLIRGSDLNGEYYVIIMQDTQLLDNIDNFEESDYRVIGVKNINEYVALECYRIQISKADKLTFNNDSRGDIFERVTRCDINIKSDGYHFNKGNDIARIYWIEQLLPDIYADIFTNAMMYNRHNLKQIESTARKLNEVLKQ
tara:strand:- start:390 stop:2699 length:2310 start_codon:yes stop_codon:yes gene_type:complete